MQNLGTVSQRGQIQSETPRRAEGARAQVVGVRSCIVRKETQNSRRDPK